MDDSILREGLVAVHRKGPDNKPLFYNPAQIFNRDLSLIVLKTFILEEKSKIESNPKLGKFVGVNILETLAATGIRGIRYVKELGNLVNTVTLNDLDRNSAEIILKNLELNEIPKNKSRVACCDGNLLAYMLTPPPDVTKYFLMAGNLFKTPAGSICGETKMLREFNKSVESLLSSVIIKDFEDKREEVVYRNVIDVVDLDPYSSATGFIDSAVRTVRSGGIVLITSTDMPTLCGNNPLVAFYKYGGTSFKSPFCHELSLRILLYSVMLTCSRYKRTMKPLVSVSVDFYVRVFVQVSHSPEGCKEVGERAGMVLMCVQCHSYKIVKICEDFIVSSYNKLETGEENNNNNNNTNNNNNNNNGNIKESETNEKEVNDNDNGKEKEKEVETNGNRRRKRRKMSWPTPLTRVCEECQGRMKMGGPLYIGPLHDKKFLEKCLENNKDVFEEDKKEENTKGETEKGKEKEDNSGKLTGITMGKRIRGLLTSMKDEVDVPLYYSVPDLCQLWSLSTISPILFKQILQNLGYKASNFHRDPNSIKTDAPNNVVMDIIRTQAKNSGKISNHEFLKKQIETVGIDLDRKVEKEKQVPRWIPNPTSHWGPKKMHKTSSSSIKI